MKAYETAADRYHNQPVIAADAMYRWAIAYQKQSTKAEYDQGKAGQAIAAYTDFITVFPDDKSGGGGAAGHHHAQGRAGARQFCRRAIL